MRLACMHVWLVVNMARVAVHKAVLLTSQANIWLPNKSVKAVVPAYAHLSSARYRSMAGRSRRSRYSPKWQNRLFSDSTSTGSCLNVCCGMSVMPACRALR